MCESFNYMILRAQELPILSMLEEIMNILMKRIQVNRDKARRWKGNLCPKIKKMLLWNESKIADCIPIKSTERFYQVSHFDGTQYVVDLWLGTCGCRKWDLEGIPCKHALSAIHNQHLNPENYVNSCYKVNRYVEVYDNVIMPINGRDEWWHIEVIPPVPPKLKRTIGRPPKARRRDREDLELRQRETKLDDEAVFDEIFNDVPTSNSQEVVNDTHTDVPVHNPQEMVNDVPESQDEPLSQLTQMTQNDSHTAVPVHNPQEMVNDVPESQDEPLSQLTQMTQNDTHTDVVGRGGSRVKYDRASKLRDGNDENGKSANDGSGGSTTHHIRPNLVKEGKKFVMPTKLRQLLHKEKSAQNLWKK
ncbi:hypothetical protein ACS0TY_000835 [Phlomoides rotata]